MYKRLRNASLGLTTLLLLGSTACSHKEKPTEPSDISVTDEVRAVPPTPPEASEIVPPSPAAPVPPQVKQKAKQAVKRTDAAAARTSAAVANAPEEGSEEEYAAEVDAAMGDTPAPSEVDDTVTVNSVVENSRVNRLSDSDAGLTADQQGNSRSDIETTRKIRRAVTQNKALSVYAHNVKIITREGRVVLKGPVRSESERQLIEDEAVRVAGAGNVSSGIQIQAK